MSESGQEVTGGQRRESDEGSGGWCDATAGRGREPGTAGSPWGLERARHRCCLGASRRSAVLSTA